MQDPKSVTSDPFTARTESVSSLPIVRTGLGGLLMGLAMLVPGISGGTMIVVMGLYDEFINSLSDVTRLRFTRRNLLFLGIVGGVAMAAIAVFSGTLSRAVTLHRAWMFSLFIGMTLGGVPLLMKMLKRPTTSSVLGMIIGGSCMLLLASTQTGATERQDLKQAVAEGRFLVESNYPRDVLAGALGMSAMVLPGVSGAYMLLILGRYETILAAVSLAKTYVFSMGAQGDPMVFLRVVIPTSIGALVSLVGLSNVLKWLLRRHRAGTLGLLLGILLGSVVGIWPFNATSGSAEYAVGALLAVGGFAGTVLLSRIST